MLDGMMMLEATLGMRPMISRIKGSMPNGTTTPEARNGTVTCEAMLHTTLGTTLGKAFRRDAAHCKKTLEEASRGT